MNTNKKNTTTYAHTTEMERYWALQGLKDDLFAVVNARRSSWGRETWLSIMYAMRRSAYSEVREIVSRQKPSPSRSHAVRLCADIICLSQSLGLGC